MTVATQRDYLDALATLPKRHRVWLEAFDIELWAYYGWGVILTSAQLEHLNDVIKWPPGSIHVWRWANRTGKTTGLDLLYGFVAWHKWRYENASLESWLAYRYQVLHAAPLGELAGKAWKLFEDLIAGSAMQQRDPINQRQRPALLAPFFNATKEVDATDVDRPVVTLANGSKIDFRSTQGKAARIESDAWWLIGWDEFARQLPTDDIPIIFDQSMLPRSSDFMAPVILAGTDTVEADHVYQELEELAAKNPADWNFTAQARTTNFSQSAESIARQRRLSIDQSIASRSLDGTSGGGHGSMYPGFLLRNAFTTALPETTAPPAATDEEAWKRLGASGRVFATSFDHAISRDDSVLMTVEVPWPPHTISPSNPVLGSHIEIVRGSRTLTGDELHSYLAREVRTYRSTVAIIDSTGEGGLMVYRKAREAGLPAVDCNLQGRAAKWVTNKEFALQGLQRLLSAGLPVSADEGFIDEWPEPEGPFGLLRFPSEGTGWLKLRRQGSVYRRLDEKLRQDAWMTLAMLGWWLWKLIGHASKPQATQPFNIMSNRTRGGRRFAGAARR